MLGLNDVSNVPNIEEFYNHKSIFLTGASGFVGSVLLETLLRCFPGIKSIYILLRQKKNKQPKDRKEDIFNKKIFNKIKNTPELLEKVHVIAGNISEPNLGMSEDDILLLEEVSIIFSCAGDINFNKPFNFILKTNVSSLNSIIQLGRKMKKLETLVYTSSAYSNSNHVKLTVEEKVYRLTLHSERFLDAIKNEDEEKLQELVSLCKPDWPNSYAFSKCLAENLIMDTASDLPIAIVRPSQIFSTWKLPFPGYLEKKFGMVLLSNWIGQGFIKVLNGDSKSILNLVPADIVAKTHVIAAWSVGTKRCTSPFIVNCISTKNLASVGEYIGAICKFSAKYPLPDSFAMATNVKIILNKYLYCFFTAYYHYLPAFVFDLMLRIVGKKPKLWLLYQYIDKVISYYFFFVTNTFEFETNNLEYLDRLISFEDRKDLTLDFKEVNALEMIFSLPEGSTFYDREIDNKSDCERQRIRYKGSLQIRCIRYVFLMACFMLLLGLFRLFVL